VEVDGLAMAVAAQMLRAAPKGVLAASPPRQIIDAGLERSARCKADIWPNVGLATNCRHAAADHEPQTWFTANLIHRQ
jgi:hypothetical protein